MLNKISAGLAQKICEEKRKNPETSIRSLCRKFKVHHTTVKRALNGESNSFAKTETNEVTQDSWTITLPKTNIHTLDELLAYCEVDLSVWQVERFLCNKWEGFSKDSDGKITVTPLYQVKAHLKKKIAVVDAANEIEALKEKAKEFAHLPIRIIKPTKSTGYCLELALVDHHFAKLGWDQETGSESYDLKIAERIYWQAFDTLLDRVKGYQFDECVFCCGNDLFQSDNAEGTTTKGTPVAVDSRYQKVFCLVRDTMIKSIEELRKRVPKVKVVMVSGNHDALSVWTLGSSLQMYFHNYKDVEIDNSPRMRKYYRYGNNLILFTHGHMTKYSDLPLLMATEQPKDFGETKFREIHTGHKHTKQSDVVLLRDVSEHHGIRVRILSALCGADDYHSDHGFVGNLRSSEAFVWSRTEGIVATAVFTYQESGQE